MAKKMKLNLAELKVDSFVTSLHDESKALVKGGAPDTLYYPCHQSADPCPVSAPWVCPSEEETCGSYCP